MANLTTVNALLKEHFEPKVVEQLNTEVFFVDQWDKKEVDWAGEYAVIVVRTSRGSGFGTAADDGSLPASGNQGYNQLQVQAKYVYQRGSLTGPARAFGKGMGAVVDALGSEIDGARETMRNGVNQFAITGGRVVGCINQDRSVGAGAWEFAGDVAKINAAIAAKGGNVTCTFYHGGTYASLGAVAVSAAAAPASGSIGSITLAGALDTTSLPAGVGAWVKITDADASLSYLDNEPTGILGNLGEPTHFGVDRTDATGTTALQSTLFTEDVNNSGTAEALSIGRMEALKAEIETQSGENPDIILSSPKSLASYYAAIVLSSTNFRYNTEASKEGALAQAGFAEDALFAQSTFMKSHQTPDNMYVFLKNRHWKWMQSPEGLHFLEQAGDRLLYVTGQDKHEFVMKWYYNTVCERPNAQGVLCGFTLA